MSSVLFICLLAECNRVPFDLPEAESELVAGFLTEYSAVPFIVYQLAEYLSIILSMSFISILYFGLPNLVYPLVLITVLVRSTLPRFKYNQLISLCWQDLSVLALPLPTYL